LGKFNYGKLNILFIYLDRPSQLRRQAGFLIDDPKYAGKSSRRADLYASSDESVSEEDEDEEDDDDDDAEEESASEEEDEKEESSPSEEENGSYSEEEELSSSDEDVYEDAKSTLTPMKTPKKTPKKVLEDEDDSDESFVTADELETPNGKVNRYT
jgi:flagellum-specific peptidoglycan hydrolase FlgJ